MLENLPYLSLILFLVPIDTLLVTFLMVEEVAFTVGDFQVLELSQFFHYELDSPSGPLRAKGTVMAVRLIFKTILGLWLLGSPHASDVTVVAIAPRSVCSLMFSTTTFSL